MKRSTILTKGIILIGLPVLFDGLVILSLVLLLQASENAHRKEAELTDYVAQVNRLCQPMFQTAMQLTALRQYSNERNWPRTAVIVAQAMEVVPDPERVQQVLRSQYNTVVPINDVLAEYHRCRPHVEKVLELSRQQYSEAVHQKFKLELTELGDVVSYILPWMERLSQSEKIRIEQCQKQEGETQQRIITTLAIGLSVNVILTGITAWYFLGNIIKRLDVIADNTQCIASGDKLFPLMPGNDEIAGLDSTFHQMEAALSRADEMKRQFFAMVSNEMKAPLEAMLSDFEATRSGAHGEIPLAFADKLTQSAQHTRRLKELVCDLLDLQALEDESLHLQKAPVSVRKLFAQATSGLEASAGNKNITIELAGDHDLDCLVLADEARLVQVLINLCSNAIKYSPAGTTVALQCQQDKGKVTLSVRDQGRGIPPEMLGSLFQKYQQVEASDAKRGFGTGLGLAICRLIVDAHGGEIGATSEPGVGSTFWVKLEEAQS